MKSPYISELQPNQVVTGTFLVQSKDIRQKKTGEPYLSMMLSDRTGELDGKMWDNCAEVMDTFERDDFVRVRGLMQVHQNRLQMTIHKVQRISADDVDFADYFLASERNPDEMFAELEQLVAGIGNPHLKALLTAVFSDPDIARRFRIAPAAKMIHHAYLGGLLEHVLSLCTLCRSMAGHYRAVDPDLLLTGALLHDVGKIYELSYDRSFGYTSEGQLLGHIVIGLRMVAEKLAAMPEFPPRLRILVEHMIVSHHGELEFGSPKVPLFPEALLLHHLDNLDSKMECMRASVEKDRQVDGCWTGFVSALERTVLKKSKFLEADNAARQGVLDLHPASSPVPPPVASVAPKPEAAAAVRATSVEPPALQPAPQPQLQVQPQQQPQPQQPQPQQQQQQRPAAPQRPAPPQEQRGDKTSPFAAKLQLALRKETT